MSEVVPLPSFGEVFFDARGQERVLRVTWHEGTLVLSLWRGEMCTASFRMPMDDVGRLLDTLDVGYAEAGGEYAEDDGDDRDEEYPDEADHQEYAEYPEYPGTGQYARPAEAPGDHGDYTQDLPYPDEQAAFGHAAAGAYGHEDTMAVPVAALSPNDVLVARGTPPASDRLVASHGAAGGYAPQGDHPARPGPHGDHPVPSVQGDHPMPPAQGDYPMPPAQGDYSVPSAEGDYRAQPGARSGYPAPAGSPGDHPARPGSPADHGSPLGSPAGYLPQTDLPARAGYSPQAGYPQQVADYPSREGDRMPAEQALGLVPQQIPSPAAHQPPGPSASTGPQLVSQAAAPEYGTHPDYTPPTGFTFTGDYDAPTVNASQAGYAAAGNAAHGDYGPPGDYAPRAEFSSAGEFGSQGPFGPQTDYGSPHAYRQGSEFAPDAYAPKDDYRPDYATPPLDYSAPPSYGSSPEYPPLPEYGGASRHGGQADAVPRENLIVNDSLPYGRQPDAGQPGQAYPAQGEPPAYDWAQHVPAQSAVDPSDPLGLGAMAQRPADSTDPQLSRPYVHDSMYTTGERIRPDGRPHDDGGRPYPPEKGRDW